MKLIDLVIIGGSNAFWEINELINDINQVSLTYRVIAILDDNEDLIGKELNGIKIQGPIELVKNFSEDTFFVFAIGSHQTRLIRNKILNRLKISDSRFVTLIHPTVKIFSTAEIGHGCIIHYGTVIFSGTKVESFSIVAANCVIAVNNLIGRGALMGSSITTTLGVKIGCFSFIGSGSNIGEGIEVGAGAMVGMGSLVLRNIASGTFVLGQPLRTLDKVDISEEISNIWSDSKTKMIN